MSDPSISLPIACKPNAFTFNLVQPERLRWLSRGRLAAGKITVLEGDPGLGKSTLLCEWAARLSRGEALPDGRPGPPRGTVILSAEDGLADIIRPRLDAAGADVERIAALVSVPDGTADGRPPFIPGDVGFIEQVARELDAAMVVIDPLVAYLDGQLNAYRDQDTRRALAALAGMAERSGAAVLLVRHLTKAPGGPALYRGGGSIGIIGAARCGLLLAADPEDATVRVLAPTKGNLATPPPSLAFRLEAMDETEVARLVWLGESKRRADELLNPPSSEKRTERDEAKEWLSEQLTDGPMAARKVEERARRAGFASITIRRAGKELGLKTKRVGAAGGGATYFWALPDPTQTPAGGLVDHLSRPDQHDQHDQQEPLPAIHGFGLGPFPHGPQSVPTDGPVLSAVIPTTVGLVDHVDHLDHIGVGDQQEQPVGSFNADQLAPWEAAAPVTCLDCGTELPPGRTYRCERCVG